MRLTSWLKGTSNNEGSNSSERPNNNKNNNNDTTNSPYTTSNTAYRALINKFKHVLEEEDDDYCNVMPTETTNYELVETGDDEFINVKPEEASENRGIWNDIVRMIRRADKLQSELFALKQQKMVLRELIMREGDSKFLTFFFFFFFLVQILTIYFIRNSTFTSPG